GGGLDRDALLTLQLHRVHLGADLVLPLHLVNLVDPPGVVEDALGQGRLARVDVRRDSDIADEVDVRHVSVCPSRMQSGTSAQEARISERFGHEERRSLTRTRSESKHAAARPYRRPPSG